MIACIEDPLIIGKILAYLEHKAHAVELEPLSQIRAPPVGLFD